MASETTGSKRAAGGRALGRGRRVYRFTVDQALRMAEAGILPEDGYTELWNGVFYTVTKGENHNVVVHKVAEALRPLTPPNFHVRQESSTRRDDHSLPEPDVAVIEGSIDDYHPHVPPLEKVNLLVEVCAGSDDADFTEKLPAYAEKGVPSYWIVDVAERRVVVCSRPRRRSRGASTYDSQVARGLDDRIEVVIGSEVRGQVLVGDLFPRNLLPG
jgi:Uma2 family endonuclease